MTPDGFRRIALAMQDAVEGSHMGHPDFRANGRVFASLHAGDKSGMVKLTPEEQAVFLREHPAMFEPSAGAWGRQGCTNVILAAADTATIRSAMLSAWELVASTPAPRKRARR